MDMILVQLELVGGQDPALPVPVSQCSRPSGWPDYLIRPPVTWNVGEGLAYLQDARVRSVPLDRFTVDPPHVGGPAEVVGVGQTTGLAVTVWYSWAILHTREEAVALFESFNADAVLPGQGTERVHQAPVDDPPFQIPRRLWSCPEIGILEKIPHLGTTRSGATK